MFYATPILYSVKMFEGSWFMWLFRLNPFAHIINAYRDIFYVHQIPQLMNLSIVLGVGFVAMLLCYLIFNKLNLFCRCFSQKDFVCLRSGFINVFYY